MIRALLFIWFLSMGFVVKAQEPRFIQHDLGDANIGITINTILQDHQSMIWLGTDAGLARYDGTNWDTITLPTIKADSITALYEDRNKRLWVGTELGEIFYLDKARQPKLFDIEEGLPVVPIKSIVEDNAGQMWFATYGEGVYVYSEGRLYNIDLDDSLSSYDIYAMIRAQDGNIWIATDNGINICSFRGEKKEVRHIGLAEGLPDQIITALVSAPNGNIYIGTSEKGVAMYDHQLQKVVIPFPQSGMDNVTALEIFDGNEIWIGTRSSGVWRCMNGMKSPVRLQNLKMQNPKEVNDILTDVEGNIWFAVQESGLISGFRPFESMKSDVGELRTIYCDHADQVWIGSAQGLYRLESYPDAPSKTVRVPIAVDLDVNEILEDRFHHLWIGTSDEGLYIYDPPTNRLTKADLNGTISNRGDMIMSMAISSDKIWISTIEGLITYPAQKDILKEKAPFDTLKSEWRKQLHFIYDVFIDSKDQVWLATSGNGAFCIQGDEIIPYQGNDSIELNTIYSITEDDRGHIWFSAEKIGLVEFDGKHYSTLTIAEGLRNIENQAMMSTGTGDMLIAHNRGFDLMELERRHFMYYGEEIGAKSIEPALNAITKDKRQQIYIGSNNEIFKYFVSDPKLSIHPRTQLISVSIFEKAIDFFHDTTFSHAENYFTFKYAGIWYTSPTSVKYRYKLENYDLDWIDSKDNSVSYSHLAPGHYTFAVKASENKKFLDEPIYYYSFTIAKPFWLQVWFLGLMVITTAGLMYWLIKSRERRSERQANLKKEMAESQLSAIKAQINPHFLFNSFNTLITIIDENASHPEVPIEYVEKLADFYRSILQYREQESISVEDEFELVRNFTYLLEKRYGHHLRLHMDKAPADAFILPLTLQILVENAVKHNVITAQKPLDVYITVDADDYVSVRNNLQPKSSSDPSTQFGLSSILKQYHLLTERKVEVINGPKDFIVRIPLIKRTTS